MLSALMCSGWVDLQSKASHQPPTPGQMWGEKCYYDPVMWGETAKKVEIQPVIRGGALGRGALKKKKKKKQEEDFAAVVSQETSARF